MSKKFIISGLVILTAVLAVGGAVLFDRLQPSKTASALTTVRLGWQTPWATQGQLVQTLQHTSIAKDQGLNIAYTGFDSGAPLNEAALGKQVDVLFTADQPAAVLLSKDHDWVIIGRLMYNRVSLYVPPKSPINSVADLNGKTVAVPFGTAAQKALLLNEENAGLTPGNSVNNINIGIYEQSSLVNDPTASKWGTIDAMAGFDPTPAVFETKNLTRTIYVNKVVSVIVMSKAYIAAHPKAPGEFLAAFKDAYIYYRSHQSQADQWFTAAAHLSIPEKALTISASVEPNLVSGSPIRLTFTNDDYDEMQATANFLYNQKMISRSLNMKDYINLSYIQ